MRLREYDHEKDFDVIRSWIRDRREHALWCADRVDHPLTREGFGHLLKYEAEQFGNKAYVAEDGEAVGFFCRSVNRAERDAMLKFVLVDPFRRGRGIGKEMIRLAVHDAFDEHGIEPGIETVRLCVFSANTGARKCYESAGFAVSETVPAVFSYNGEMWDRICMFINNANVKR